MKRGAIRPGKIERAEPIELKEAEFTIGATEAAVLEEFGGKEAIEQLIFMYALLGFGEGKLTVDEFQSRVRGLVQRHRSGDTIHPHEIEALAA